ncbi:MAG: ABC transporter substrate-binding protein [bacterium]|nr:ABC transporter substrate-binding protein [bacterium]
MEPFIRERRIKGLHELHKAFESFSITSKAIFLVAFAVFAGSVLSLTVKASGHFMVDVPHRGGTLVEGVVGTPRFINPLLASSDADRDLVALVYSGLLKATPDGGYVNDLSESFTISDDGLLYSFTIRKDAVFHDGEPLTADDIEFTVLKAQDSTLKSPRRVSWEGVTVEKKGTHEIAFRLKQPYAPFIGNLSLGILPRHIWQSYSSDQFPFSSSNVDAIGSGPYRISSIQRAADGLPTSYSLSANKKYTAGEPYISRIVVRFYASDNALMNALRSKEIESASNLGPTAGNEAIAGERLMRAPYTRVFGIFFNHNQREILTHKEARKALDAAIDKQNIVENVLKGFATVADGPLPPALSGSEEASMATRPDQISNIEDAQALLIKGGWKMDPETGIFGYKTNKTTATTTLSLSLATANVPELVEAARHIEENWKAIGAEVDVKVFEPTDLNQAVIRPRKYDALLFGIVTGKNPDLYAFWHSSQRNDPGLNIALYTNSKADNILTRMRQATDSSTFQGDYAAFAAEVAADTPAIFLWSPDFIYAVPDRLQGVELGQITTPSDRFQGVEKWHLSKERVWKIFAITNIRK